MSCADAHHFYLLFFPVSTAKIKPDGVQRGLVGNIISRFETKGYKLVAMKTRMATADILDEHYKDLVDKPFFPKLRKYLLSGPVVSMCWEGKEAGKFVLNFQQRVCLPYLYYRMACLHFGIIRRSLIFSMPLINNSIFSDDVPKY